MECALPDVLPGICRLFLHIPSQAASLLGSAPRTTPWEPIVLGDTGVALYRVKLALLTEGYLQAYIEAVFLEEPRLDQLYVLGQYAASLGKQGLPALLASFL